MLQEKSDGERSDWKTELILERSRSLSL